MNNAHVTVAAVVERDGRFLFVEEHAGERLVINQPAGHWENGETLTAAAVREALEETGWDVELLALLGVYEHKPQELDYGFLRFAFVARALRHDPARMLDAGIVQALWLTPAELAARSAQHRSPMVQRCVHDHASGRRFPLDLIAHLIG
jgi:ADP-ribose pyrophosphatase YjhB (NUDIX family)